MSAVASEGQAQLFQLLQGVRGSLALLTELMTLWVAFPTAGGGGVR